MKKMKKQSRILAFLLTLTMLVSLTFTTLFVFSSATEGRSVSDLVQKELKLWYDEPAPDDDNRETTYTNTKYSGWEVWALPIGNGYAGSKVFGLTERERIQINENTLSTNGDTKNSGTTNFTETYVHFNHDYDNVTNYYRDLVLNDSISHVSYDYNGVTYTREYFASYPDGVIVLKFDASGEDNLDFTLEPKIPYYNFEYKYGYTYDGEDHDPADVKAELLDDGSALITLEGYLPGINDNGNGNFTTGYGMYFEGQFKVFTDGTLSVAHSGGSVDEVDEYSNGTVTVSDASTAYVIIALGTNYEIDKQVFTGANNTKLDGFAHPHEKVSAVIDAASQKSYDELRAAHVADHTELFSRVALDLGGDPGDMTTDELIAAYKADDRNAYVEELLFAYGRYLHIASSREGGLPSNLNGIWNRYHCAVCMNGYWHNINTQMNYWSTFNTNLAECFSAYLGYYSAYAETNHKNAINALKAKGYITSADDVEGSLWSVATGLTPFAAGSSSGGRDGWGNTPLMAEIFWDYYDYTGDVELLEDTVFPAILASANFLSYVMQETEDGLYLSGYSGSPEQSTTDPYLSYVEYHPGYIPQGSAYDQSLAYSNYLHVLEAVEILGYTDEKLEELGILGIINRLKTQVDKLDPIVVGYSGQVKEFREENYYGEIGEKHHRHISQLCALVQGSIFTEAEAAAWLDAAEVTMENRGHTPQAWADIMRISAWARIGNGDEAYDDLCHMINGNLGTNMLSLLGGIFQVEANLAAPSALSEMLLQSHEGFIAPLPALPSAWADGAYSGLVARGGFEVGAAWTDGFADEIVIVSKNGGECSVQYINIATATVKDQDGNSVEFTKNGSDFITFNTEAGKTYTINGIAEGKATEKPTELAVEYDASGAHLTWQKSSDAASYNVYRATNSDPTYTLIASDVKSTEYVIANTDFDPSNQYTYAVSAVASNGRESGRSFTTMIPIVAPDEAKGVLKDGELTVYISKVVGDNVKYRIYEEKDGVRKLAAETSHLAAVLENASSSSIYTVTSVINGIESEGYITVEIEERVAQYDTDNILVNKPISIVNNTKYTVNGVEYVSGKYYDAVTGYPLTNAVDGDATLPSRWGLGLLSGGTMASGVMIEIDAQNECDLGMMTITSFSTRSPGITVMLSLDHTNWTEAKSVYNDAWGMSHRGSINIDLTGNRARYIRVIFNATASTAITQVASITEIACAGTVHVSNKVDSTNVFLNKGISLVNGEKYTVNGTEYTSGPHSINAAFPLANVLDGDTASASRWALIDKNYPYPLMVEIDCESRCELGTLTITTYKIYNPCILILTSVDGDTWTTAAMKYDETFIGKSGTITMDLTGVTARYVRIVFNATAETDNGFTQVASIKEISCPGSIIVEETPSKLELQKAINKAEAIDKDLIASLAPDFLNIIKSAVATLENDTATKSKIDETVAMLNTAIDDLKAAEQLISDSADRNYGNLTFEFDEDGSTKYKANSPGAAIPAWVYTASGQPIDVITKSELDNKYLSFVHKNGAAALSATKYWEMITSDWQSKYTTNLDGILFSGSSYDYAVFDMDFTTYQYVYTTADGKVEMGTSIPEGATDAKLAYPEGLRIYPIFRSYDANDTLKASYARMSLVSENGEWYIARHTGDDGRLASAINPEMIKLKNGIGEWNHITTVIKTNQSSIKDTLIYNFVNGELLAVYKAYTSELTRFHFGSYRTDFSHDTIGATPFEIDYDNITTNYYGTGDGSYSGDLAALTSGSKALKWCSDAVYNRDYVNPDGSYNEDVVDRGYTLLLEGETHINKYLAFELPTSYTKEYILKYGGVLVFTEDNAPADEKSAVIGSESYIATLEYSGILGGYEEYRVSTDGIPAKEMGDLIYFRPYVVIDGEYFYGDLESYSVLAYCEERLKNSDDEALKNTVIAMLNYGAASQAYFGYKTDSLVNAGLTEDEKNLAWNSEILDTATEANAEITVNFTPSDALRDNGSTLILEGAVSVKYYIGIGNDPEAFKADSAVFYFWTEEDYNALKASGTALTKDNASYTKTAELVYSGSVYGYEFTATSDEFVAKELGKTLYSALSVTDADGAEHVSGVRAYSPETYAYEKVSDGKETAIDALVKWLTVYGEYARLYFSGK